MAVHDLMAPVVTWIITGTGTITITTIMIVTLILALKPFTLAVRLIMHGLRPFIPALRPFALALRLLTGGLMLAEAARTAHEHKQRPLTQHTAG